MKLKHLIGISAVAWATATFAAEGKVITVKPGENLAKAFLKAQGAGGPVTLRLAPGLYESETPLTLTYRDKNVTVEGPDEGQAIISAGRRITGWKTDAKGWWHASVPAEAKFGQFYVNGVRRERPFLPRKGYFFVKKAYNAAEKTFESFYLKEGDYPQGDNPDIEFCLFQTWTMSRTPVMAYDAATGRVTIGIKPFLREWEVPTPQRWYRLDNVKTALGEPGEWYLDRAAHEIIYVPMPGETPANCETIASWHTHALHIEDSANLTFRNVVFAYGNHSMRPAGKIGCGQAAVTLPGMVQVESGENVRFENCAFMHTGAYALAFVKASTDGAAIGCEFFDLGAGGIKIGDAHDWKWGTPKVERCVVEECLISGGGRFDPAGVGVWIGHARNNRVSHCTIHDLYYSGISAGWNWCFAETARDNILEWNHIYDIGQHVLSDMGGIYLLGRQPGTVERYNHIHHVTRARNCAFGVYFDSGTSLVTVTNCLTHDCEDNNWFMARISCSNRVENNIFASATYNQINVPSRDKNASPSLFARNIVAWDDESAIPFLYDPKAVNFTNNICWCPPKEKPKTLPNGFVYADPGFADLAKRDYTLKPNPTLEAAGFQPFSLEGCGRRLERRYTKDLARPTPVFFAAPPGPIFPVAENFETLEDGVKWPDWCCSFGNKPETIQVTSETAATGKKSICFTDTLPSWQPHAYMGVSRTEGRQRIAFAMRLEAGAQPQFEVRDHSVGYGKGPEVRVNARGQLCAREGRVLCDLPMGVWMRIGLEFELGPNRAADTYSVRVKLPGEEKPRVFNNLPISSKFRQVQWLGFMSYGETGAKYWIDDFRLVP